MVLIFNCLYKIIIIITLSSLCLEQARAINAKAIANASESILGNDEDNISVKRVYELLKEVDQEETNPTINLVRYPDNAEKIIGEIKLSLLDKINLYKTEKEEIFIKFNRRVEKLLSIIESTQFLSIIEETKYFQYKIPLSYLLEGIDGIF